MFYYKLMLMVNFGRHCHSFVGPDKGYIFMFINMFNPTIDVMWLYQDSFFGCTQWIYSFHSWQYIIVSLEVPIW